VTQERDQELAALYRAGATEEPPAHLDRTIRDAARRATRSPLARFTPFSGRWPLALSAAAVAVMTTTLLVYQVVPDPSLVDEEWVPRQETTAPVPEVSPPNVRESSRAAPADGGQAAPPAAPSRDGALRSMQKEGGPASLMRLPANRAADEGRGEDVGARVSAPAAVERELAAIGRLLAAGDIAAARRRLEAFVERHPDHKLPAALGTLMDPEP